MRPSFPEAIANERGEEPLLEPKNVSSHIRRRLLHGQTVSEQEIAEEFNMTKGLVQACTDAMTEWGFIVTHVRDGEGVRHFKLENPEHVPVVRVPRRPPRQRRPRPPKLGTPEEAKEKFLSGERMSVESMRAEYSVSTSYLRQLVSKLEREGYVVSREGVPATYQIIRRPGGPVERSRPSPPAKLPVNGQDRDATLATMVPAFLSELKVIGLVQSDDGEFVTLMLRDGDRKWSAEVTGFQEIT